MHLMYVSHLVMGRLACYQSFSRLFFQTGWGYYLIRYHLSEFFHSLEGMFYGYFMTYSIFKVQNCTEM